MLSKDNIRKRYLKIRKKKYFEVKKDYFDPFLIIIKKKIKN